MSERLAGASAIYLRSMTKVGLGILERQDRSSYHARGFAQDVYAENGTLIHAELHDDGFWNLSVADTGEHIGLFIPDRSTDD